MSGLTRPMVLRRREAPFSKDGLMAHEQKRVCVARIGAAHGTRGEVRLWSFTADPPAVAQFGPLESEDGRVFEIAALRPGKGFFVARLKNIVDRTAAERLNNVDLFVPRERLPALDAADEYYHADLIGLAMVDTEGAALGRVVAIQNFGAADLIEVAPAAGGETVLLPFTEAVVPVVDIAGGRIVAHPLEELLQTSPPVGEDGETASPPPDRGRACPRLDRGSASQSSPGGGRLPARDPSPDLRFDPPLSGEGAARPDKRRA